MYSEIPCLEEVEGAVQGGPIHHGWWFRGTSSPPPWIERQTHMTEDITFPQLHWRGVNIFQELSISGSDWNHYT